jgi:hypothetical protein
MAVSYGRQLVFYSVCIEDIPQKPVECALNSRAGKRQNDYFELLGRLLQLPSRITIPAKTNNIPAQSEYGVTLLIRDNQLGSVRWRETTIKLLTLATIEMTILLSPISCSVPAIRIADLLGAQLCSDTGPCASSTFAILRRSLTTCASSIRPFLKEWKGS